MPLAQTIHVRVGSFDNSERGPLTRRVLSIVLDLVDLPCGGVINPVLTLPVLFGVSVSQNWSLQRWAGGEDSLQDTRVKHLGQNFQDSFCLFLYRA